LIQIKNLEKNLRLRYLLAFTDYDALVGAVRGIIWLPLLAALVMMNLTEELN
jgi:hypothetical protein